MHDGAQQMGIAATRRPRDLSAVARRAKAERVNAGWAKRSVPTELCMSCEKNGGHGAVRL
jgi:hypothetical protein